MHIRTHTLTKYTGTHRYTHGHTYTHPHTHIHTYTLTLNLDTHTQTNAHTRTHARTRTHAHTHTRTYAHMHTRTYALTHTRTNNAFVQARAHRLAHTQTHTNIHTHANTHTHTHTHRQLHVRARAGVNTCTHAHACAYTHAHRLAHTQTHTNTHTHTHRLKARGCARAPQSHLSSPTRSTCCSPDSRSLSTWTANSSLHIDHTDSLHCAQQSVLTNHTCERVHQTMGWLRRATLHWLAHGTCIRHMHTSSLSNHS